MNLNLAGLSALLKALEAAMAEGQGRLSLGGRIAIRSGSFERFAGMTLTYDDAPDDRDPLVRPDPRPVIRTPVLALQD